MTISKTVRGIYIHSSSGTGKTTIVKKLYHALRKLNVGCDFVQIPELLLEIRETFKGSTETTERDIIDLYTGESRIFFGNIHHTYLFLDDFGAEKQSEFTMETLYLILDRCERDGNPIVIITSNYSLQQLSERVSDRIASRIAGLCDVVKLDDIDYRTKKYTKFVQNDKNKKLIDLCENILNVEKEKKGQSDRERKKKENKEEEERKERKRNGVREPSSSIRYY